MFVPFNAPKANALVEQAKAKRQDQDEILIESYLNIIHVHVERACDMGKTITGAYIPDAIFEETNARLTDSGFKVFSNPHKACWYWIDWQEKG